MNTTAKDGKAFAILATAAGINADGEFCDEFSTTPDVNLPQELQEALREERARERKKQAVAAAKQIIETCNEAQELKKKLVAEVRRLRLQERDLVKKIRRLESHQEYAKETGDYIQLFAQLNGICFHPGVGTVLYKSLALYKEWQNGATKAGPSADESTSSEVKEDSNDPAVGGPLG